MAEIRPIGDLAHELESLYEGLIDRRYSASPMLAGLLQQSHDQLARLLEQLQAQTALHSPDDLIESIRDFRLNGAAGQSQVPANTVVQFEAEAEAEAEAEEIEFDVGAAVEPEMFAPLELPGIEEEIDFGILADVTQSTEFGSAQREQVLDDPQFEEPALEQQPDISAEFPLDPVFEQQDAEPLAEVLSAAPMPHDERDPELVEIFLEEGFDIMDSAGAALQRWMDNVDNSLELESLQRDLHTLKGGARMAEIREIGDLAHELEFLYEGLGQGRLRPSCLLYTSPSPRD